MDHLLEAGKLLWFIAAPSNLIFGALIAGALLLVRAAPHTRLRKAGAGLAAAGIAAFALAGLTPLSQHLLRGLERTWPPFDAAAAQAAKTRYAGIDLLGGAVKSVPVAGGMQQMLGEGGERIRYAAQLARAFPDLPVFIAAGAAFPRPGMRSEAEVTAAILEELGIDRRRMRLDSRSRNTVENARQVKALLSADGGADSNEGCFILVTSAFHMRRAAAIFQSEGLSVAPAPTDWRADPGLPLLLTKPVDNLAALDLAAHEYAGLAAIPPAAASPAAPVACQTPARP